MPYCRKLQPPEYGARALPTTDGRATAYSEKNDCNLAHITTDQSSATALTM